jgi:hypothetical protein
MYVFFVLYFQVGMRIRNPKNNFPGHMWVTLLNHLKCYANGVKGVKQIPLTRYKNPSSGSGRIQIRYHQGQMQSICKYAFLTIITCTHCGGRTRRFCTL